MNKFFFVLLAVLFTTCGNERIKSFSMASPPADAHIQAGETFLICLRGDSQEVDSIVYSIDEQVISRQTNIKALSISTKHLTLGQHLLCAKIYQRKRSQSLPSYFTLLPSKPPQPYSYEIMAIYPHDTSAYTQGLIFDQGILYESAGGYADLGGSSLRKVHLTTGKVLKKLALPPNVFAEGVALVGKRIIQLTWQNGYGIVYDKGTFQKIAEFPYQNSSQGWGLCYDGKRLLKSDGSNRIFFLNKDTYQEEGYIEVFNHKGAVNMLNALAFVDGMIFANIYQTNEIAIIDPNTGEVKGVAYLAGLLPVKDHFPNTDVLNGIAWDKAQKRLFLTGKKWNKLFQVKLIKLPKGGLDTQN